MAYPVKQNLTVNQFNCHINSISATGTGVMRVPYRCQVTQLGVVTAVTISSELDISINSSNNGTVLSTTLSCLSTAGDVGQVATATPSSTVILQQDDNIVFRNNAAAASGAITLFAVLRAF